MKIVVTDSKFVNPGDLSWKKFEEFGEVEVFQDNEPEALKACEDADAVLINKTRIDEAFLKSCPKIRYIGVTGTGYDVIDVEACRIGNIVISNCPEYGTDIVAEYTFGLILQLSHEFDKHDTAIREGRWNEESGYCFWLNNPFELQGKTLGIIGYGRIGKRVCELAKAFKMKVLVNNGIENSEGEVSLEELLTQSDIVTLHCNLTEENKRFANKEFFDRMKKEAYFINVARGGLVEEEDLKQALNEGKIKGAAVDVVSKEPIEKRNPLLEAQNLLITPHIAWVAKEARERIINISYENLKAFLEGSPQNRVGE